MKIKDLKEAIKDLDDEKEIRVLDAIHEPLPNYIMSHNAETFLNTEEFFCIIGRGKGLFPINREKVP